MKVDEKVGRREWWIDFRNSGDVVHDSKPKHVQGECVHVLEATPAALVADELVEALDRVVKSCGVNHDIALKRECLALLARARGETSERKEGGGG